MNIYVTTFICCVVVFSIHNKCFIRENVDNAHYFSGICCCSCHYCWIRTLLCKFVDVDWRKPLSLQLLWNSDQFKYKYSALSLEIRKRTRTEDGLFTYYGIRLLYTLKRCTSYGQLVRLLVGNHQEVWYWIYWQIFHVEN